MNCPHCQHELTPKEIAVLYAGLRKNNRGGRPPNLDRYTHLATNAAGTIITWATTKEIAAEAANEFGGSVRLASQQERIAAFNHFKNVRALNRKLPK